MTPAEPSPAGTTRRVLDPVDRASEVLFGLIMVLTFTTSLSVTEAGRADVRAMLIGALGCNLAWGIIDAVMFLMGTRALHALAGRRLVAVQKEGDPASGRALVADALPPMVLTALSVDDLERIRQHIVATPATTPRLGVQDWLAAVGVFGLVFACTFPVVLPFVIWGEPRVALAVSNAVAISMLFLTGYTLGREAGRPLRVGLSMVALGVAMVAVAAALGG
jgi:hypothetical protein